MFAIRDLNPAGVAVSSIASVQPAGLRKAAKLKLLFAGPIMSLLLEFEAERVVHPVDIIEHIASINDWTFERQDADEIAISVRGGWSDYHVSFNWMEELESLHIAAAFDLKIPEARRAEVNQLIAIINERMWIGHFDVWGREGVILFRNSHLLSGGAEVTPQQCEALLRSATEACDQHYQAFQFVVWAGKSADEALSAVMFETVGEA